MFSAPRTKNTVAHTFSPGSGVALVRSSDTTPYAPGRSPNWHRAMVKLSDDIGSFSPIDWSYSSCSVVSVLVKFRVSTGIAALDLSSRSPCDPP